MNVSVVIATCGDDRWRELALDRAYPSARAQAGRFVDAEVVVEHHAHLSVSAARNAAAATASGEWLCFLDADDTLAPGYLAAMSLFRGLHGSSGAEVLLVPAVRYIRSGIAGVPTIPNRGGWPAVNECVIGTIVRRAMFERVGGFREWPSLEDYDLWLRCFDAGAALVYVPGAVYQAHVSADGGRNLDQSSYPAIWADHLARTQRQDDGYTS